ncbi:MAG TPA: SIMPL domain-containing protein [Candidatus Baltobacteraceae bacterium]|jgi:hypothetical protein|nr:SIMPL domain-containing protein [Candidatus Baltobacteraceae bacterium]
MHVLLLSVLITVSAQGRASAQPDMATETLTISTNAASAAAATADNNSRFGRLMAGLESIGVPKSDIQTVSYAISYTPPAPPSPTMGVPGVGTPPVTPPSQPSGYFVNRSVQVTLNRLDLAGKSIDTAVAAGVTDIGGVTFGVRNNAAQVAFALQSAVATARRQASAMAQAAGLHIVRVRSLQQGYAEAPVGRIMMASALPAPAPPTTIEPSSVEVTATVTVSYEAQ